MAARASAKAREPEPFSEDDWQRRATAAAVEAARHVASGEAVNSRTPVGSLSELEWGWIVSAALFGWITVKAQQAIHEGIGAEITIRHMRGVPNVWDVGVIHSILPAISSLPLDWGKPIGEWSREAIVQLGWAFHQLIAGAIAARDEGDAVDNITGRNRADIVARNVNAAAGNGLLAPDEMNDEIPF